MKHLKTCIAAFTIFFFAVSCKKESNTIAPAPVSKKLQKITWVTSYPLTQNYLYDAQGRLIKYEDEYDMKTWTFLASTVTIKEFRKTESRMVSDITGTLDNAGRVTNLTGSYSYNINAPYTEQTAFIYDAEGYLKQFTRTAGAVVQTYDYTVTDGDYTKLVYQKTNAGGYTMVTDFYTEKNDLSGIGAIQIGPGNYHTGLFGKTNKHLKKHEQLTQQNAPTPSWTQSYAYTFDNDGYVKTFETTGTSAATGTYTYQ